MGLLDRLRGYREETSQRIWSTTSTATTPTVFTPDLILEDVWDRDSHADQAKVAWQDPIARYIVGKLSENVFDDWFKFVDAEGNEILLDAQKMLSFLDAKHYFTQVLTAERTHGWSWLYTGKAKLRSDTVNANEVKIANLDFFTPIDCSVWAFDEFGGPQTLEIKIRKGSGESYLDITERFPAEDFILVRTRPFDRSYMGKPALEPIWDCLTQLRFILDAVTFYDRKIGMGAFSVGVKGALTEETRAAIKTWLEDMGPKRALVYESNKVDKLEFINAPGGSTNFHADIDALLVMIAAGSGIPKDILAGVSAGAISGSEINNKSLFATLNQIQKSMEPYIRELVTRMGYEEEYEIEWNTRFAHDEEEEARINYLNTQALAMSTWMTSNEIREAQGLGPVEGGDELLSAITVSMMGGDSDEESEQDHNTGDEQ